MTKTLTDIQAVYSQIYFSCPSQWDVIDLQNINGSFKNNILSVANLTED